LIFGWSCMSCRHAAPAASSSPQARSLPRPA
jgi:hypothetical protein